MMFPKPQRKKKRKKHKSSILQCKDGTCYLCMKLNHDYRIYPVIHEHHVYDGPNRRISEAEGFKVYLCQSHHIDGKDAVHKNIDYMRLVQQDCQKVFEENHTRQEFMELIGRNYLEDNEQESALIGGTL